MSFLTPANREDFKVKFYINILPTEDFDWDCFKIDVDRRVLYAKHLFEFHSSVEVKPQPKFWCFRANGIFLNCCQEEVYEKVTNRVFQHLFLGVDHTVMCYGQNFSGKSFTLSGFHNQYELRGIIPRFAVDLFNHLENKLDDYAPKVLISVVDIYKNSLYDLLSHPKRICKDLKNVKQVPVSSEVECLKLLFKAEAQRIIVGNKSYTSHSSTNIVTFTLKLISVNCNEPVDRMSKIHFVDLAGVETVYRNPVTSFKHHFHQGDANFTKTMLELYALRSKKSSKPVVSRVNQNQHVLTRYLNKSLTTTSCISLICNIRPVCEDMKMTLSALKFGKAFQGIPVKTPEEHTESNYDMTLQNLSEEIKNLKDELLLIDLTQQKVPIRLSQERIDFVKRTVNSYLTGELTENDLLSLVDEPNLILSVIKSLHNEPTPKKSVILQTELFSHEMVAPKTSKLKKESPRDEESIKSSIKRVSIKETRKGKLSKAEKTKGGGKAKGAEKVSTQSEEIQVNLIEPPAELPQLESREGLWAMFLISRPDIHEVLEKLNACVAEKNKKLLTESSTYDAINQSVNKAQLALNHLVTYRHTEPQETYDQEGKVEVPEYETNLVKELRELHRDLDQSKQRLIDAQFDWLEALEKLSNEKELIEEDFKRFCTDNNFLVVPNPLSEEEEVEVTGTELQDVDESGVNLKNVYCEFQKKYLNRQTL